MRSEFELLNSVHTVRSKEIIRKSLNVSGQRLNRLNWSVQGAPIWLEAR